MLMKFKHFVLLLSLFSCSTTLEFIPEPEYTLHYSRYKKASWEEVEILQERPEKSFQILGEVVLRNQNEASWDDVKSYLKKAMWERKMDGVWIVSRKKHSVEALSFQTMDARGHTTHAYEYQDQVPIFRGYAFRYKQGN
ncbi:hypothetical protein LPTSP3_g08070 [Leptospira kobayashii]|uniref:Lipoprotein n=2 Tax=Leptospira kobayashii TaxID=1917830 RepID=A0ABM7UH84_9LEPT|nr:hypothetical protein LPTSP3_g08070 [Leptospira kobayashii]